MAWRVQPPRLMRWGMALLVVLQAGCAAPLVVTDNKAANLTPVLWRDTPAVTESLAPRPPFRFVGEDRSGDSPKFDVVDTAGATWRVKLGPEAHTEVAATRLLTKVGYFADTLHYLPAARIDRLRLTRGHQFLEKPDVVRAARFEARPPRTAGKQ